MKTRVFGILQRIGRSFMLPIAVLPIAGLFLGIGSSLTNETTISSLHLEGVLGNGTFLHDFLIILTKVGSGLFNNLPLIFAAAVALGMAKKVKEVAVLSSIIAFFVMHTTISGMLSLNGSILDNQIINPDVLDGTITAVCGIMSLEMGVFGGIIVGLGVSYIHNRFYQIELPRALSFFEGERFIPIISTIVYLFVGIVMFFIWPFIQNMIFGLGKFIVDSGYFGTFIYGIIKRALVPFGLHHLFYLPFWQTAVGGSMLIDGLLVQGGQNIFFAQLADPSTVHFSADATRYFSGEFIFMIFGLPGAALAMYHCAKPEKKKQAGGLLLSAALTCMLTGITEPLEFSFLFVAPLLFGVQVVLAGSAYMIAHMLNIAVGLTFSGGLIDLFIFGILQGNAKTNWMLIIPAGVIYFILYYVIFRFLIQKFQFKTPGREDGDGETKLYTKADYKARQGEQTKSGDPAGDERSILITQGLGGKKNISDVDCCATRLRCTVVKPELVNDQILKQTGPSGIVKKGQGIQIIYGPSVTVVKSNLEDYLVNAPDEEYLAPDEENVEEKEVRETTPQNTEAKTTKKVLCSPFTGEVHPIADTPDEAFAGKMMGDGYMVMPVEGVVYAPEDSNVTFVFPTNHAIGLTTVDGVEYLLHIGVDTVKLEGKGFEMFVKDGDFVKKGDKLMAFDIQYIKEHAKSEACIAVFTGLTEEEEVVMKRSGHVNAQEEIAEIVSC